jgi:hypothetical protein
VGLSDVDSAEGASKAEAIVALSKADGSIVWSTQSTWAAYGGLPGEVLALADDEDYVYAGLDDGHLVKVGKSDGMPVLDQTGQQPLVFVAPEHPLRYPRGVWALDVEGDRVWAALNHGGPPSWEVRDNPDNPRVFRLLTTSVSNRMLILDKETLDYAPGVDGPLRYVDTDLAPGVFDEDQAPRAQPSIYAVTVDPAASSVYVGGQGILTENDNRTFGVVMRYPISSSGVANPVDGKRDVWGIDRFRALATPNEEFDPEEGFYDQPITGGVTGIAGDGEFVFVSNLINRTTDGEWAADTNANVVKLDQDLQTAGWFRPSTEYGDDDFGRRLSAWNATAIFAEPGPAGRLFVGHDCDSVTPYPDFLTPQAGADDFGVIRQKTGAYVAQLPKDDERPTGYLMFPTGRDVTNGVYPIGFRIDAPVAEDSEMTFDAKFFVQDTTAADPAWRRMPGVNLASLKPNDYYWADNVALSWMEGGQAVPLPEGGAYRLKLDLRDAAGQLVFADAAEGTFMVDRTPPVISAYSPVEGHIDNAGLPTIRVEVHDALSGVSTFQSAIQIDGTYWGCLDFERAPDGEVTGFVLDVAKAIATCDEAPQGKPLSDGFHVVRVEALDRARNFAFVQFRILVDSTVLAPQWTPLDGSWTPDRRPNLEAHFFESVALVSAEIDGLDVTDRVSVVPQDEATNRQGTKMRVRAEGELATGTHRLELWVEDEQGNVGGPFATRVRVDARPPFVQNLTVGDAIGGNRQAADGVLLTTGRPTLGGEYGDAESGPNFDSLRMFVDGTDVTRLASIESQRFSYQPLSGLGPGWHDFVVRLEDTAGNDAESSARFQVDRSVPRLEARMELPADQEAVKQGDVVRVIVEAEDDSAIARVALDAKGLNPSLPDTVVASPVPGAPGVWEAELTVQEGRTRPVSITAFAVDDGGLENSVELSVLVDNQAPLAFMKDLPGSVGASFAVAWENNPPDAGSGVAYYVLERQLDEGPWEVIRERVAGDRIVLGFSEPAQATLRFRVTAVDHAGNRQPQPSNAVETVARGDPFENVVLPSRIVLGSPTTFAATLARGFEDSAEAANLVLIGPGAEREVPMALVDRLYSVEYNATGLPTGDYIVRFHLKASSGSELASASHPIQVVAAASAKATTPDEAGSPGLAVWAAVAAVGAACAWARRRRLI